MPDPASIRSMEPEVGLSQLVDAAVEIVVNAWQTNNVDNALLVRDQLHRLPDTVMVEVINQIILRLVQRDPHLCRWFIVDIFLRDANPEGRADVAERINLLLLELQSSHPPEYPSP